MPFLPGQAILQILALLRLINRAFVSCLLQILGLGVGGESSLLEVKLHTWDRKFIFLLGGAALLDHIGMHLGVSVIACWGAEHGVYRAVEGAQRRHML